MFINKCENDGNKKECERMSKPNIKDVIEEVLEEAREDIESCAIMTGYQPRENCDLTTTTCEYRKLCEKIFKRVEQE